MKIEWIIGSLLVFTVFAIWSSFCGAEVWQAYLAGSVAAIYIALLGSE